MATETRTNTFYPGTYDATSSSIGSITDAGNPVGKGSGNTTRATVLWKTGANAETILFWPLDTSGIPAGAVIDSVSCKVHAHLSATTYTSSRTVQLYSGDTPKGNAHTINADQESSAATFSLTPGSWTREELSKCRLRFYVKRSASSTTMSRYIYFYGADLTVSYTYQSEKFMLKLGGADPRLPEGYTRLPFLESTGVEYIATNIPVKSTTGFVVDFALSRTSGENGIIGGFTYGGLNHNFAVYSGEWYSQWGNNEGEMFGAADTNRHVISQNVTPGALIFDGETVKTGATFYDNTERTFNLFCYNGGPSYPDFWIAPQKQWGVQFYDSGGLVGDFIPCINPAGIAGMYDAVGGVFYRSASGTDFPVTKKFWYDISRTFKKVSGIWIEQTELANVVDQTKRLVNGGEIN